MAMGRLSTRSGMARPGSQLAVALAPRHAFYDRCNELLATAAFDAAVEALCQSYYAEEVGRPSIPPGRYFRMLFVGQFEGLASEREIAWRCADSLSLHRFLRLAEGETVPDHSTLSVTRQRLPLEVHHAVFGLVLEIADQHELVAAQRIGVDASTQEANASLRRLVRRDTGEDYQQMLRRLAQESGLDTPSTAELIRFDRKRKSKTLSNAQWLSQTDPDARITKLKDGRTHLAYKPEHVVDLDTDLILTAKIHPADQGDTRTLPATLAQAAAMLDRLGAAPTPEHPAEIVTDKGYFSRDGLKNLDDGPWRSRMAEPARSGVSRWHGDRAAQRAVYNNRARLKSGVARIAFKLRAEKVERSFALILDVGGLRRTWLRGVANVEKRYSIQVAAYNLGVVMRHLFGVGTPRQAMAAFWLLGNASQSWDITLITILVPPSHDPEAPAGAAPTVLVCLLISSI
jgi:transposase